MGNKKRILLVEDDALVARIYRQKLTNADFDVSVAEDGLIALKLLPELKPDVVVLDLFIPKLNGLDVLKFLRQQVELKFIRVVVFSNTFLPRMWEQVAALGVDEMLLKSAVTPAQLIETIARILKKQSSALPAGPVPTTPKNSSPARTASPGESAPEFRSRIRHEFFQQIPVICKGFNRPATNLP